MTNALKVSIFFVSTVLAFALGVGVGIAYKPQGDMLACRDAVRLSEERLAIAAKMVGNTNDTDLDRLAADGAKIYPQYARSVTLCRARR